MERGGGCFPASLCPAYALTVFRDGVVEYTGVRDVKVIGKQVASIPVAKVDQLIAEYERTFPRLRSYTRSDCTDQATVTLTFRGQTLNHDYGDAAAPLDLHILETLLDHTTDSQQWTGGPGPFVGACGGAPPLP
jgi:hypothetical protein